MRTSASLIYWHAAAEEPDHELNEEDTEDDDEGDEKDSGEDSAR